MTSYKFMQKESDFGLTMEKYAESKNEFELRFMIVSIYVHFLDKVNIDEILTICGKIDHDDIMCRKWEMHGRFQYVT